MAQSKQTSGYWLETMDEILAENGVAVRPRTVEKIAEQVEGAASVSVDYAAPAGDKSVEYVFEEITCPQCWGDPDNHISYNSRIASKQGCSVCKGKKRIKIVEET